MKPTSYLTSNKMLLQTCSSCILSIFISVFTQDVRLGQPVLILTHPLLQGQEECVLMSLCMTCTSAESLCSDPEKDIFNLSWE